MNLRGNLGMIALAVGMLLIFSGPASAKSKKQICFEIDSNEYLFVGKIPWRNKCTSFQTVDTFGIFPGFMSNGAACLSGDGSTLLLYNLRRLLLRAGNRSGINRYQYRYRIL